MTPGWGGTLGGPGLGRLGSGAGSFGTSTLLLCLSKLVSLFFTKDSGSLCGSTKDQGLKLTALSLSGLCRSSLESRRIRFFGGCRFGVRSLFSLGAGSASLTPESSEWAGPEDESSSSPPDTKPASRSIILSVTIGKGFVMLRFSLLKWMLYLAVVGSL